MNQSTSEARTLLDGLAELDDAALRARIAASHDPRALLDDALRLLERQKVGDPVAVERDAARLGQAAAALLAPHHADAVMRRAILTRAPALTYANRFGEALTLLDDAARGADQHTRAEVMLRRVQPLARLGRLPEAAECAHAAARGFADAGDPVQAAKAEVNAGVVERMRGRIADALAAFDRARPVFTDDPPTLAQVESNRAVALLELARFADAEAAFNAALRAFTHAGLARAVAIVEGNLADLDARRGRVASALRRFERAVRLFEQESVPGDAARVRAEAAELSAQVGLVAEAARMLDEALPALVERGMRSEAARARLARASLLQLEGRREDAIALATEARDTYSSVGNPLMAAACELRIAEALSALSRHDEARVAFDRVLAAADGRPLDTQHAAASAGLAALAAGDLDRARRLAAAVDGLRTGHPILDARASFSRGMVARASGHAPEAAALFRGAINELHAAQGMLQADRFRVAFMGGHGEILARFVAAMLDADHDDELAAAVFESTELARSHALLASLTQHRADSVPDTDDADTRRLSALREDLSALYTLLERDPPEGAPRDALRARIRGAQLEIDRIERSMLALNEPLDRPVIRPADIAASAARDNQTIVSYYAVGDELFATILHGSRVILRRSVASLARAEKLLERLAFEIDRAARDALARPDALERTRARAEAVLTELGDLLWAPIAPLVTTARVTIVPFGRLHAAPWPALMPGGTPIAEAHEVTLCPSVAALVELRRRAPARHARSVLVAAPDAHAPRIAAEAADLAPRFDLALVGEHATAAAVGHAARSASLIHLATHGSFDLASPLDARLRLGDRWVSARELFGLRLPASVVILTGCETGRAALAAGDETLGLTRALFAAGASLLLTSAWPVHDAASHRFASLLYDSLAPAPAGPLQRAAVVAAHTQAMRALRREHPHPLFWAPFVPVGAGA